MVDSKRILLSILNTPSFQNRKKGNEIVGVFFGFNRFLEFHDSRGFGYLKLEFRTIFFEDFKEIFSLNFFVTQTSMSHKFSEFQDFTLQ
jgi:hypothetical protein